MLWKYNSIERFPDEDDSVRIRWTHYRFAAIELRGFRVTGFCPYGQKLSVREMLARSGHAALGIALSSLHK